MTNNSTKEARPKLKVCLFGLSADPPTGIGGHASIVQALLSYTRCNTTTATITNIGPESSIMTAAVGSEGSIIGDSTNNVTATGSSSEHQKQATTPCQQPFLDQVWIVPVYRHTFPSKQQRLVSFEHRLRMCELAFLPLDDQTHALPSSDSVTSFHRRPRIVISSAEYESWKRAVTQLQQQQNIMDPNSRSPVHSNGLSSSTGPHYSSTSIVSVGTATLMEYLDAQHDAVDIEFYFCLGGDSFLDLIHGKWKESSRVLERFHNKLLVVPRVNHEKDVTNKDDDDAVLFDRAIQEHGAKLLEVPDRTNLSSSQVRACHDEKQLRTMVVPSVLAYMQEHHLYSFVIQDSNTGV